MFIDVVIALACLPAHSASLAKWACHREFEIWLEAGQSVNLWWRDDDAREPGSALDRLIGLSEDYRVPLALAVIPDRNLGPLGKRLGSSRFVTTVQHGVDHVDRSEGRFPSEFRPDDPVEWIARRLSDARARFDAIARHCDMLTPPWNRASANIVAGARAAGLYGFSGFGGVSGWRSGLFHLDTHVDLLRWRGSPQFRGEQQVYVQLLKALRIRRETGQWQEPIGLLTHHLVHDRETWRFLARFIAKAACHPAIRWRDIAEFN